MLFVVHLLFLPPYDNSPQAFRKLMYTIIMCIMAHFAPQNPLLHQFPSSAPHDVHGSNVVVFGSSNLFTLVGSRLLEGSLTRICGLYRRLPLGLSFIVKEPGSDFGLGLRKFRVPLKHYILWMLRWYWSLYVGQYIYICGKSNGCNRHPMLFSRKSWILVWTQNNTGCLWQPIEFPQI